MAADLIESGSFGEAGLAEATASIPLRQFGTADDLAEAVCFLASDRAGFITGQTLNVDGGYSV
jgi:NAD(P)-dependent dehydrogenase (short-subunit alcohol dehydrogenase family)